MAAAAVMEEVAASLVEEEAVRVVLEAASGAPLGQAMAAAASVLALVAALTSLPQRRSMRRWQ